MSRALRTFITRSLLGGLFVSALVLIGCGGGGGSSPVGPSLGGQTSWSIGVDQVRQALLTASGSAWAADETAITLELSQEEAGALCGLLPDPLLSSFSATLRTGMTSAISAAHLPPDASTLPRRFSWLDKDGRNWTSPAKAQGKYGTCVAFATIAALETGLRISRNQATASLDLSEWDLWLNGTRGKQPLPGGWYPSAAAAYLVETGVPAEEFSPYETMAASPNVPASAERTKVAGWSLVAGRDSLKQALLNGPIISSMRVRADFFFYRGGIYEAVAGPEIGDHAILLVGFDDDTSCWIAQNSWSAAWGENGFFRIRYGQLNDVGIQLSISGNQPAGRTGSPDEAEAALPGDDPDEAAAAMLNIEPYISEVTATSAVVCWTTHEEVTSRVEYGTDSALSETVTEKVPVTRHAVRLANLSEATDYRFRVSAQTDAGVVPLSSTRMFSTLASTATASPTPIIYDVLVSNVTKDSAVVSWKTDKGSTSSVRYSTTTYASTTSDLRIVTSHVMTLRYLTPGTRYDVVVSSAIDTQIATSEPAIFTTQDAVPPVITDVSAHTITKNSATVVWKTDELSTSQVEYGKTTAYGLVTNLVAIPSYGHQVVLTGLAPATPYYYRVRSKDGNQNESAQAGPVPFTTLADTVAPVDATPLTITDASATAVTHATAQIVWLTDRLSTAQVEYGTTPALGLTTSIVSTLSYGHLVNLSGLTASQTYYFRVRSKDAKSIEAASAITSFRTLPSPSTVIDASLPQITNASATAITYAAAQIVWLTDRLTTSQVEYGTTPALGLTTPLVSALSYGHLVNLSGLSPAQVYYYRVRSKDSGNRESYNTVASFTTLSSPVPVVDASLPVITNASATAITKSSAQIVWLTDRLTTGQVEYGTTPAFGLTTPVVSTLSYGHLITLSGLEPSQTYYFRVRSRDAQNAEASATAAPFFTLANLPALEATVPQISDASATGILKTSAQIVWLTDTPATSQVEYGTTPAYGLVTPINTVLSYGHLVNLSGLAANQTYYYRVRSRDARGSEASATAAVPSFTTPADTAPTVDPTAPVISSASAALVTGTTATIVWLTNEPATTQVEYGLTDAYGWISPLNTTLLETHKVVLNSLIASRTYYFRVRSKDIDANEAIATGSFLTVDTLPPAISNVFTTAITGTSATVTFVTNEPCTAQVEYGLTDYGLVARSPETASTTFAIPLTGLTSQKNYKYRVRIYDQAGNSVVSAIFSFTTLDIIPPIISNITVSGLTSSTAVISWTTDKAATAQLDWGPTAGVYSDGQLLDQTLSFSHTFRISWLIDPAAAEKHFSIMAADGAGNVTISGDQPFFLLPVISNIAAAGILPTSANVTCTTNLPTTSVLEYGTTPLYGSRAAMTPIPAPYGTAHSVALTGLVPLSAYHYRIRSVDQTGRETVSTDQTFSTPASGIAPVITNLAARNITPTTVQIGWQTDKNTSAIVEYGTTTGLYTMQAASTAAWSTSHAVSLQNLLAGRTYYYRVRCTDAETLQTVSGEYSFLTPGQTSPLITAIQVTDLASSSAVITWKTDQPSSSQVQYGITTSYNLASPFDATATMTHAVTLTQLSTSRLYHFRVRSRNDQGLEAVSTDGTFLTPDQSAPVLYDLFVQNITGTSATIIWKTDENSDSKLEYGTTLPLTGIAGINSLMSKNHAVLLTGLTSSTTYTVNAVSKDGFNNVGSLSTTFSTLDRTGPVISDVNLTPLTATEAVVTWVTNEAATSQVEYGLTTTYGSLMPQFPYPSTATTTHAVTLSGLANPATYHFRVRSTDGAGNLNISRDFVFTTTDKTVPVISGIAVQNVTNTSATIVWKTDEAADSAVYFGPTTAYLEAGSPKTNTALVKDHSVTLYNLSENTTYHFLIRTKDAAGNQTDSEDMVFTTMDLTAPVISNVATPTVLENGATISWTTDEAASSRVEYGLTTAYGSVATVTEAFSATHSVTINGLTPFTTYHFRVRSTDAAGNETISGDYSFVTRETLLVQNVKVTYITQSSAIITWTTNIGAACYLRHGTALPADFLTTEDSLPWGTNHSATIYLTGAPLANTTYFFQIRAFTGSDVNAYSEIRSFVTP
ncbi:MAG TPA: fibronectin type III domain-containing protein [Candidatus Ozemobacteraceae bacterium]